MSYPRPSLPGNFTPGGICPGRDRRGVIVVLTGFMLCVIFAFMALSVDSGRIVLTETEMQNAVDAAALAASQEIAAAVHNAGQEGTDPTVDPNSIAAEAARDMAATVAAANGVHIDPQTDVRFGKRRYDPDTNSWPIVWDATPVNVVQVVARKDNPDATAADAKLPLAFGWAIGRDSVDLTASATAFVEARDMVLVLDFSGSMNDDSDLNAIDDFGTEAVTENLGDIYQALDIQGLDDLPVEPAYLRVVGEPGHRCSPQCAVTFKGKEVFVESTKDLSNVVLQYSNGVHQKFDNLSGHSGTFSGTLINTNQTIKHVWVKSGCNASGDGPGYGEKFSDTNQAVKEAFGLDEVAYPYPSGSWNDFINHCRNDNAVKNAGYRQMYGGVCFADYLLRKKAYASQTPDLWKTPHYPFHAVKNGASLFLEFLSELDFGDEVGLVSYGTYAMWETEHDDEELTVNISNNPITSQYSVIDQIQRHHQASHYANYTGMGDGVLKAREMLVGNASDADDFGHSRYGARPTMILMTDGQANRRKSNWSLPSDFSWHDWTDYDGDGTADYSTSDKNKQYAFWEATEAIRRGVTIHTMAVGAGADRDIMRAIAFAGDGVFISVPGGSTISEMEDQMLEAFSQIAANVPPAKLVYDLQAPEED